MSTAARRRLMILGAGKFQVPLIVLAREMGFETIVVSRPGDYPGFDLADRCHPVDVRDRAAVLELARSERICGILTDQTDLPVPTVAYVAEQLSLPGIGYERALRVTNKGLCREHCRAMGFPIPESIVCASWVEVVQAAGRIGYPLIVKPPDSQGARGVARVDRVIQLSVAFRGALAHSACGSVLVETVLPGRLIWMTGFLSAGRYTNLLLGDSENFDLSGRFIHRQSIHPAAIAEEQRWRLRAMDCQLFESLGAPFGVTFSQYMLDEERGDVRLVEAALRSAAGFTSSHLVPLARGFRPLPLLIEFATGSRTRVDIRAEDLVDHAAGTIYFMLPPGIIRRVEGLDALEDLSGVELASLERIVPGARIGDTLDSTGVCGPIVFFGQTREDCERAIDDVMRRLRIEVEGAHGGTSGIQWQ